MRVLAGDGRIDKMLKKLTTLIFTGFLAVTLCGCIAVMAYMADTAKAKQELDISYSQAVDIVKAVMKIQGIQFKEASIKENIAEAKGRYTDDRTVRIYIHKISDTRCAISVRVGVTVDGKKDAEKILQAIIDYSKDIEGASGK